MSITRVENVPKIQLIVDLLTVRTRKHVYKLLNTNFSNLENTQIKIWKVVCTEGSDKGPLSKNIIIK